MRLFYLQSDAVARGGKIGYNFGMIITLDLPPDVADTLTRKAAQEGRDVAGYVRQLAVQDSGRRENGQNASGSRVPGLHAGRYWIAEDFDAPLPDSFWLGEENLIGENGV